MSCGYARHSVQSEWALIPQLLLLLLPYYQRNRFLTLWDKCYQMWGCHYVTSGMLKLEVAYDHERRIWHHPWAIGWHHDLWRWMTLNCPRSRSQILHIKYLECCSSMLSSAVGNNESNCEMWIVVWNIQMWQRIQLHCQTISRLLVLPSRTHLSLTPTASRSLLVIVSSVLTNSCIEMVFNIDSLCKTSVIGILPCHVLANSWS